MTDLDQFLHRLGSGATHQLNETLLTEDDGSGRQLGADGVSTAIAGCALAAIALVVEYLTLNSFTPVRKVRPYFLTNVH